VDFLVLILIRKNPIKGALFGVNMHRIHQEFYRLSNSNTPMVYSKNKQLHHAQFHNDWRWVEHSS
jgi:hypothetical protein